MTKNNQTIAIFILVPMLLFTFIVTIQSQSPTNDSKQIIYNYYEYKNKKDLDSISKLLLNVDNLQNIKSEINNLDKISLINIIEEKNNSIMKIYLKDNKYDNTKNIKAYKVKYEITYDKNSDIKFKDGVYESWCFLVRKDEYSKWMLDVYDI